MKKRILFLFIVLLFPALIFGQVKKPIVASDLMKIATTGQIQISPDAFPFQK